MDFAVSLMFDELTRVFFLSLFFFKLILQHWIDWELDFVIYFDFLYIKLLPSHESGKKFCNLTRINLSYFFVPFNFLIFQFQFHPLRLGLLGGWTS